MIAEVLRSGDIVKRIIQESTPMISLDALWGIFGTVLGTILGWLLSEISNRGRLHCYVKSWQADMDAPDFYGGYKTCRIGEIPQFFHYSLSLELYNSSRLPRMIRNGKVVFCKDDVCLKEFIPKDRARETKIQHSRIHEDLTAFCVPASGVLTLDLLGTIMGDSEGFPFLEEANEVYFQYNDEKNKIRKWKIANVSYDSYFDNDIGDEDNG